MILTHRISLLIIVFVDLLYSSRTYRAILPDFGQRVLLSAVISISFLYLIVAFVKGYAGIVLLTVGATVFIVLQMYLFEANSSMPVNPNGFAQYSLPLSAVVFFVIMKNSQQETCMNLILFSASTYSVLYLSAGIAIAAGFVPASISAGLTMSDVERGSRLFGYGGPLSFAFFFYLRAFFDSKRPLEAIWLVLSVLANLATLSRFYILCMLFVTSVYVFGVKRNRIRALCLTGLYSVSLVLLYGIADLSWNPFLLFSDDTSGSGRALEYQVTQFLLSSNAIFGVGLASEASQWGVLTGITFFAPGDLGAVGILIELGVIGVILFFLGSVVASTPVTSLDRSFGDPLFLTGCVLTLSGCISPGLFVPGGGFYFAVILGFYLAQGNRRSVDGESWRDCRGSWDKYGSAAAPGVIPVKPSL